MLSVTTADGVRTITLRRPQKRNALTLELRLQLADELRAAADADDVAATIVTGEGSAFCAGFDMTQFGGDESNRRAIVETTEAFFDALVEHPKPLIAAVNGPAVGGGFALALLSDLRLASETATFGFSQVRRGIPPSYAAARAVLPPALARELCLTGRMLDAREALVVGLVSSVASDEELLARAGVMASELAPPSVTGLVKRLARVEADRSWLALLEAEKSALRTGVLGE
jgi:enoyl-CoA hydratase